jgi:mono/diheme cytochrome c family protein
MLKETPAQLVAHLAHPNGWWRDNAQKQLVVLGDRSVVPALKQIVRRNQDLSNSESSHLEKIHALWTLEGLDAIDEETLLTALGDPNAQVRRAAVWISEPFIKKNDEKIISRLAMLKSDPSYDVRTQLLLSLYQNKKITQPLINFILEENKNNEMILATAAALERNENIKSYGRRLGSLSAENRDLVIKGSVIFRSLCASCHGEGGVGLASKVAPPLVGSKNLSEDKNTAIRIMLNGISGPIAGQSYPGDVMPPFGGNNDEWVAAVLSYARFELRSTSRNPQNNVSPFIVPEEVSLLRDESNARTKPWTVKELNAESLKEKKDSQN